MFRRGRYCVELVKVDGLNPGGSGDALAIDDGVLVIGARTNHSVLAVDVSRVIAGDFKRDGVVDVNDLDLLIAAVVQDSRDSTFDLSQDEVVGTDDVRAMGCTRSRARTWVIRTWTVSSTVATL